MLLNHLPNNKRSAEFVQTNMCVHFCKCEILLAFTSQQMLNIDYAWIDSLLKCLKSSHKSGIFFLPLSGIFTVGEIFAMFNGFNSLFCVGIFELLCAFWRNATYYGIDNLCKITESASDQIYQPPPSPMLLLRCDCTLHITKIPCKLSNILNQNIYDFGLIQSNSTFGICIWLLDWNCFLISIFYWMGSI